MCKRRIWKTVCMLYLRITFELGGQEGPKIMGVIGCWFMVDNSICLCIYYRGERF